MHKKRYGDVRGLVDESEMDDLEEYLMFTVQGTLDLNGYDSIDEYGVPCNFNSNYDYSQLSFNEYYDDEGFIVEYDLTSNSEPIDLVLQLRVEYKKNGVRTIFENIVSQ